LYLTENLKLRVFEKQTYPLFEKAHYLGGNPGKD
jgi:hypothetical protein